jgi:hypothetical protein
MGKPTLTDLQAYVDGIRDQLTADVSTLSGDVATLKAVEPQSDSFEDIRYRSEAVKEATVRLNVIAGPFQELSSYVDEVLKVAGFLLGENSTAPVTIYNDHYHYNDTAAPTAD